MKQKLFDSLFPEMREPVSPEDVIEQVLASAKAQARSWGEGNKKETPNRFDVAVNGKDWQEYFSKHTEQTQARIADMVFKRLSQGEYSMEGHPQVWLYRDSDPDAAWINVRATFTDSMPRQKVSESVPIAPDDARGAKAKDKFAGGTVVMPGREGISQDPGASKTVKMPSAEAEIGGMSPSEYADALDELVPKTEVMPGGGGQMLAVLESADGMYSVAPGFRVGADRAGDNTPAQILLPKEKHAKTSRDHGIFLRDGAKWVYVNYGKNGTTVAHADGGEEKLDVHESCNVGDGDTLYFGTEDGYRFVIQ